MQVRKHHARRSNLFKVANRTLPLLWRSNLLPRPELLEEELVERAMRDTGLRDFGDPWFRKPLRTLMEAVRQEANLNPVGRMVAYVHMLKLLKERLKAEHWFAAFPEIRERPLPPPIVVVGPMRSGTTRLHRLLAADTRFSHLRLFEAMCPVPPGPSRPKPYIRRHKDKRHKFAARTLKTLHLANPDTAAIHPTDPFAPEEELGLLVPTAWGMKHEAQWRIPGYGRWCEQQDATPAYQMMADLLRLTGWFRGDPPGRPWILKTPQHTLDLKALLAVFPDAKLIFIHRDPAAVVGSSCSLVWNQMLVQSDEVDPRWIGREWLRKTSVKLERMDNVRATMPEAQMLNVSFEEMDRDWVSEMRRIYAFLGMDMAPAQQAMHDYLDSYEQESSLQPHRYRLADFGLEADAVREQLVDDPALFADDTETQFAFVPPQPLQPLTSLATASSSPLTKPLSRLS